jgi:hypothetical protein
LDIAVAAVAGVLAGLTVYVVGGLFPIAKSKYRQFQIRFMRLRSCETPQGDENANATSVELQTGSNEVIIRFSPRYGIRLKCLAIDFFDNRRFPIRVMPYSTGTRREVESIRVDKIEVFRKSTGQWTCVKESESLSSISNSYPFDEVIYTNSHRYYKLHVEVQEIPDKWDGIMSFRVDYMRDGNYERRDVHSKIFKGDNRLKPIAHLFKSVARKPSC